VKHPELGHVRLGTLATTAVPVRYRNDIIAFPYLSSTVSTFDRRGVHLRTKSPITPIHPYKITSDGPRGFCYVGAKIGQRIAREPGLAEYLAERLLEHGYILHAPRLIFGSYWIEVPLSEEDYKLAAHSP
jgi:hypothetical protein